MELLSAKKDAFDLREKVWELRPDDTKTEAGLAIPLPDPVIEWIEEAMFHSLDSEYIFPARRLVTSRMGKPATNSFSHVGPDTLNVALNRLKTLNIEHFTVHDMRRTARTHLARMGIESSIAERALNHAVGGVEATYNQWDYFSERREALDHWLGSSNQLKPARSTPPARPRAMGHPKSPIHTPSHHSQLTARPPRPGPGRWATAKVLCTGDPTIPGSSLRPEEPAWAS